MIPALLSRLESLSGPDREVDAEIDVCLFGGETVWKTANYTMESYPASRRPSKQHIGGFANEHVPLYTASLDSVVALIEQKLPGWVWDVSSTGAAWVLDPGNNGDIFTSSRNLTLAELSSPPPAMSPQVALLIALLKALEQSHAV